MSVTSTPVGCISKAEERLRNMLAACVPLQRWMNVDNAAAAKDKIYVAKMEPPVTHDEEADGNYHVTELQARRPYCILWTSDQNLFKIDVIASPNCVSPSGTLQVLFEENIPDECVDNYAEAYRRFLNTVGSIMHSESTQEPGLVELLPQAGYLAFRSLSIGPPVVTPEDAIPTQGLAHQVILTVDWGATA